MFLAATLFWAAFLPPFLFAPPLARAEGQTGSPFRYQAAPSCHLKKYANDVWSLTEEAIPERTFELKPSNNPDYSTFKLNGTWYAAKSDCFVKSAEEAQALKAVEEPVKTEKKEPLAERHIKKEPEKEAEEEDLSSLHYFTGKGKLDVLAAGVCTIHQSETLSLLGGSNFETDLTNGASMALGLTYGITPHLDLTASANYLFAQHNTRTDPTTGDTIGLNSGGISDPSLLLNYRIMDGVLKGRFYLDLAASVQASVVKSQFASTTFRGTNALGFGTLQIFPTATYSMGSHEFQVSPKVRLARKGSQLTDPTTTETLNSYTDITALTAYRFHLNDRFYVSPLINWEFGHTETKFPSASTNISDSLQVPFNLSPGVNIGYKLLPNLLLSLEYDYASLSLVQTETDSAATTVTTVSDELKQNLLTLSILWAL